jgi:membrane protein implicated in regulation of membrane protease activity
MRRRSVSPAGRVCGSVLRFVSHGPSLCSKRTKTNVDSLTGRKAVVKDRIDNVAGTGTATLAGETWLARAAKEGDTFETGDVVVISAVSGAKLMVAAAEQEHEVEKA